MKMVCTIFPSFETCKIRTVLSVQLHWYLAEAGTAEPILLDQKLLQNESHSFHHLLVLSVFSDSPVLLGLAAA